MRAERCSARRRAISLDSGSGLQFDQWSTITLEAKITAATRPVPTPTFLKRALHDDVPVAVTTVCRGSAFEVSSIKFAD